MISLKSSSGEKKLHNVQRGHGFDKPLINMIWVPVDRMHEVDKLPCSSLYLGGEWQFLEAVGYSRIDFIYIGVLNWWKASLPLCGIIQSMVIHIRQLVAS